MATPGYTPLPTNAFGSNVPTPFVISGLGTKAAVPGGVNTAQTNTIAPKYTAPAAQQTVSPTSPNSSGLNLSGYAVGPNGNVGQGTQAQLMQQALPTSYQQNVPTANALMGPLAATSPSTPVKSISMDGQGGQTVTYHPPTPPPTPAPSSQGATPAQPSTATQPPTTSTDTGTTQTNDYAPTTDFNTLLKNYQQLATTPPPQVVTAQQQLADAQNKLQSLNSQIAKQFGLIEGQAIPIEFQQGQEQVLARQLASQQDAAQQLVTQSQGALTQAQTQYQQQLTSYHDAITAVHPQLGAFGQGFYSPTEPGQNAASGQYGTGPAAAANVSQINALQQQVDSYSAARNAGNTIVENQLKPFIQQSGVNPTDINRVNSLLQTIAQNVSDPRYQILNNLVTEVAQSYSSILAAPGQDPSVWTSQTAKGLIDGLAKGQSMLQVIDALDAQAHNKISGYQDTIQKLQSGGNVNPSPKSSAATSNPYDPANYNLQ